MSILDGLRFYHDEFGIGGVVAITTARLTGKQKTVQVDTPGIKYPVTLRIGTSDHRVYRDIFQRHEYLLAPPNEPKTIIDAGANIGLTSVYFANRWPKARIIAIEPEPSNYALLLKNAQPYPQITPVLAALWNESIMLNLFNPGKGEWAFQTEVSADGKTRGMTLDEVMQTYQLDSVDLLKIDIEGAEKEVFENASWVDRVGTLVIEIHDDLKPGAMASVLQIKDHFPHIYNNGANTWCMQRKETPRPAIPMVRKGRIL